jgi:ribosomal-protein-alanine N-acetyltransferase
MTTVIMPAIRAGGAADLEAVSAVQAASPEAAQWDVAGYLGYDFRVAVCENRVAGFLVCRAAGADEYEILNLAVAPEFRRGGVARALLRSLLKTVSGSVFLEVRASNQAAIDLYKSLSFEEVGRRPEYYRSPSDSAIVMKFHSC